MAITFLQLQNQDVTGAKNIALVNPIHTYPMTEGNNCDKTTPFKCSYKKFLLGNLGLEV